MNITYKLDTEIVIIPSIHYSTWLSTFFKVMKLYSYYIKK